MLLFVLVVEMLVSSSLVLADSPAPTVSGRMIDAFVGTGGVLYPSPYGGQGLLQVADMFEPQEIVSVWALVTYNGDAVQSKLVTFIVMSPSGLHDFSRTAISNGTGYAYIEFRIPWPNVDPYAEIFGIWNITVKVDIRSEVVEDVVWFKVWWPVEITSVKPKAAGFSIDSLAVFSAEFRTYLMQPVETIIEVTVYDGVDISLGVRRTKLPSIGWGNYTWGTFRNYTQQFEIQIPSWASGNLGKAYANVYYVDLTNPYETGSQMCPQAKITFTILRTLIGDVNSDGRVDGQDMAIVSRALGTLPGDPGWDSRADLNHDGRIDGRDLAIVSKNFGTSL